jgi:uncharacterized glyoxalase superfamily protein PhnB
MQPQAPVISIMLAVADTPTAVAWYTRALGATDDDIKDHQAPWGTHRQGYFIDPFGHIWLVGDQSPLSRFSH